MDSLKLLTYSKYPKNTAINLFNRDYSIVTEKL